MQMKLVGRMVGAMVLILVCLPAIVLAADEFCKEVSVRISPGEFERLATQYLDIEYKAVPHPNIDPTNPLTSTVGLRITAEFDYDTAAPAELRRGKHTFTVHGLAWGSFDVSCRLFSTAPVKNARVRNVECIMGPGGADICGTQ